MDTLLESLFRTTLTLSVLGGLCWLLLRKTGDRIPRLSRFLWLAALLTGWFWLRPAVSIPLPHLAGTPAPPVVINTDETYATPLGSTAAPARFGGDSGGLHHRLFDPRPAEIEPVSVAPAFEWKPLIFKIIPAVWIGGMLVWIFLAAAGYVRFLLLLRKTVPASDDFAGPWRRLLEEHGIDARSIPMLVSDGRAGNVEELGPALVRTVRGYCLVIPHELWSELSESGRCGILKHELEHFRRRDVWKSFFVRILALPHWFNPVAHLALHRFEEAAELLCDRVAFECRQEGAQQRVAAEFAKTLLLLYENAPTQFVARPSIFGRGLKHRVACLLHENQNDKGVSTMKKIFLIAGAVVILTACLFRVEFVQKTAAQEHSKETLPDAHYLEKKVEFTAANMPEVMDYIDLNLMNTNCSIRMKKMQAALMDYHRETGRFPRPFTTDADGKSLHSWRVTMLPYLGEKELYHKIRKDEPWNSEYNKPFHSQCPEVYRCPFAAKTFPELEKQGLTTYALIVGKTAYPTTEDLILGKNFFDGTANTLAIVERKTPVCWMDPNGDIPQDEAGKGIDISPDGIGVFHDNQSERTAAMCFFDGSVQYYRKNLYAPSLQALITPNGGEAMAIQYDDEVTIPDAKAPDESDEVKKQDRSHLPHLMVLAPQGDFKPRFMIEINDKLRPLWARANDLSLAHMKTWPENDKNGKKTLVVGICVSEPEAVREMIEKEIPEFSVLRVETPDEKAFEEYVEKKSRNINGQVSREDATQNTHMIVFTGKDDFDPKTSSEIQAPVSQAMRKTPPGDKPIAAGWTRSWVEDGRRVGALLTNDPQRLEKMISELPGHQILRTEKLTEESLEEYLRR